MNESSIRQETGAVVSFSALCHAPCAIFIGSDHGGNVSVKGTALLESSRDLEPMQVDRLRLLNFKGFATLDQGLNRQFTLITGNNGVGKSNLLDALSIAFGAFLLGIPTVEQRHISQREVREFEQDFDVTAEFNRSYRVVVEAEGRVEHPLSGDIKDIRWKRELRSKKGRSTTRDARELSSLAEEASRAIKDGHSPTLPLFSWVKHPYSPG